MRRRDDDLLIADICQCCANILQYTAGMSESDFLNDSKTIDAVVRNFEVIGEASKRLSPELKAAHPLIEWRLMADFRNKLIHDYFGIDHEQVWHSIQEDIPANFEILRKITF